MPELLSLSRAARLADVTRAELQKKIRRGELATFEGQIAVSDLLRVYPKVSLDHSAILERVEFIKETAQPKTYMGDPGLPSAAVLVSRLQSLGEVLLQNTTTLNAARQSLAETAKRLREALAGEPASLADEIRRLLDWLDAFGGRAADRSDPAAQLFAKDAFLRIMAANVKIIPSGHEFFVEGSESILYASVRAGLNLSYGCSSGNCGSCKARVVSGQVWKIRDHDYVLSEQEKRMGYVLTCSNTAVTDVMLEAAEALSVEDLPQQEIRSTVRKFEPLAADVVALHVQTPRTQTLRFMAGQRARLAFESGDTTELHVASCPCNGRNLQFYVRRKGSDAFAARVFGGLKPPGMVTVTGPFGQLVLQEESSDPSVFIAYGDGFAPVKSLIEHAVSIDAIEAFHLYWLTSEEAGHYMDHWCRSLRDALDNFRYVPLPDLEGQALVDRLGADCGELDGYRFYVVGPEERVTATEQALLAQGVALERIVTEILDQRPTD